MDVLEQEIQALKAGLKVLAEEIEAAATSWIAAAEGEAKENARAHLLQKTELAEKKRHDLDTAHATLSQLQLLQAMPPPRGAAAAASFSTSSFSETSRDRKPSTISSSASVSGCAVDADKMWEVGSKWPTQYLGDSDRERKVLQKAVHEKMGKEQPDAKRGTVVVIRSSASALEFWCTSCKTYGAEPAPGEDKAPADFCQKADRPCKFVVRFGRPEKQTATSHYVLKEVSLEHTCDPGTRTASSMEGGAHRNRNVNTGVLDQSDLLTTMKHFVPPKSVGAHKSTGSAKALYSRSRMESGSGLGYSYEQIKTKSRNARTGGRSGDSALLQSYMTLPTLFQYLQESDKEGFYQLETEQAPDTYYDHIVAELRRRGGELPKREEVRVVSYFILVPSSSIKFHEKAGRSARVAHIDFAHLTNDSGCSEVSMTAVGGGGKNTVMAYGQFSAETKHAWEKFIKTCNRLMPWYHSMIADNFTGLVDHRSRCRYLNNEALPQPNGDRDPPGITRRQLHNGSTIRVQDPDVFAFCTICNRATATRGCEKWCDLWYCEQEHCDKRRLEHEKQCMPSNLPPRKALVDGGPFRPCAEWRQCFVHVARNAHISGDSLKGLKSMLMSSDEAEFARKEATERKKHGDAKMDYFLGKVDEMSMMSAYRRLGEGETLLNTFSSNSAEQVVKTHAYIRGLGPSEAVAQVLEDSRNLYTKESVRAQTALKKGYAVDIAQVQAVKSLADSARGRISINSFSEVSTTAFTAHIQIKVTRSDGQTFVFDKTVKVLVPPSPESEFKWWYEYITCSACNQTRSSGRPCQHGSYVLMNWRSSLEDLYQNTKAQDRIFPEGLTYSHPAFYQEGFRTANIGGQYDAVVPVADYDKEVKYFVLPSAIMVMKRRLKNRLKKKKVVRVTSPCLTSPHLASPHLTSPHLTSPHLTSPHLRLRHLSHQSCRVPNKSAPSAPGLTRM